MKRIGWLALALASLLAASGCGDGIADSSRDRQERYKRVLQNDAKQLNDDIDAFLLMDRPSRLGWARAE